MKLMLTGGIPFLIAAATIPALAQTPAVTDITGTWRHNSFYYMFSETGIMSEVQIENEPVMYNAYYYESVPGSSPMLIRYGRDMADSASCAFLIVTDLEDSTATIAYGTSFARDGEGDGLRGKWVHADDLTIITWEFGTEMVSYTERRLDLAQGIFITGEHHDGTFTRGQRDDSGRFFLSFDDGSVATVYPLIAGDIMYLFDLTGRRSKFVRAEDAPAYAAYRDARTQSGPNEALTR